MIHLIHQGIIACGLSTDSPLVQPLDAVTGFSIDQVTCPDCIGSPVYKSVKNPRGAGRKPRFYNTGLKVSIMKEDKDKWDKVENPTEYVRRLVHEDLNR